MKKVISLFLSLTMLLSIVSVVDFSAYADVQTGKLGDNVTYSLDTETGLLTISGTGDMYDYKLSFHDYNGREYYSSTPLKMENIKNIIIESGVTDIGDAVFFNCKIQSITIPDTVTRIGNYAFIGFKKSEITLPNSVISIAYSAFNISVEGNISYLKKINYNGTVTQWNSVVYSNKDHHIIKCTDGIIGNGNTVTIDNFSCNINNDYTAQIEGGGTENLIIPETVSYEGYSFRVTSIGRSAFNGCTSLTNVTIPNSVTSIGDYAFEKCTNLTRVNYSGTVSQWKTIKIGSYNEKLRNAIIICTDDVIGNGNTVTIDNLKYKINNDYTAQIVGRTDTLGNLIIPEPVWYEGHTFTVTSIVNNAFSGCSSLTSVTIPNSVESIGDNAFQNCSSLTSATIGNNVTSIGSSAFFGCSKLKKIEIPDSVTYIGSKAFDGTAFYNTVKNWEDGVLYCGNHLISAKSDVTKITVKASTVSIAAGALDNCKSLKKINVLNPKCVINCTIPKTAVIGGAEGSTAEDFAQKNNMSIDYFEECTHSDKVQVVIAATCTEQGAVQSRCADCDKLISQTFTAPLGHTMVITTPAKAPTCTTSGNTQAGYCTVCGYNEVSTVIPATGHNFGNNSANCLVCGVANPNYVAPAQPTPNPTPSTAPTQPNQNDTNTSNDEDVTVISKPKSASIKKVKGAKKAILVTWKKVSGVNGYEIQVATDKKFKKNKKTVTIKKQKTTKTTVKKLKAKKKYYVRVRTYKIVHGKKVYSSWSKVK
uniref:leucine-rich repeat protein n=1 Tax=Eubacterium sp. TaxID=142586 RepID=UPI003FEFCBEA